jgi:hypothetical protein
VAGEGSRLQKGIGSSGDAGEETVLEAITMFHKAGRKAGRIGLLLLTAIAMLFPHAGLWAQADRGTITGTVTDPSGAAVPGVKVVAIQTATNVIYQAISNETGTYSVLNLPIGTYSIAFSRAGFKSVNQRGVVILANHTSQIDVKMEIGSTVETVQVNANPVLEVQPEVGTNLSQEQVNELPLSLTATGGGRDQLMFAFSITPNVGGDSWYSSVNGSQQYTKNVLLDGTSIDSGVVGDLVETGPSPDAIQEVQADTTGIRAEEARTGGGVFMAEMKSGTNKWHGSAFGYLANEALNANTWDNNWYLSQCGAGPTCANGNPRSQYVRARDRYFDYGFSGGGPIWKNHTFFYVAYEKYWQDDWRTAPTGATAPTAKMLTGDFSELLGFAASAHGCASSPCAILDPKTGVPYTDAAGNPVYYGSVFLPNGQVAPGNVIPSSMISPISQKILAIYQQYYKPTGAGVVNNFPKVLSNDPHFAQYQFSVKFDHNFSAKDHFASSYIWNHRPKTEFETADSMWIPGSTSGGPFTPNSQQDLHTNAYRFSESHTFSPNVLNVVSFTFNQFQNLQASLAPADNWASKLGLQSGYTDGTTDFPQISYGSPSGPNGVAESTIGSTYNGGDVAYNGILNESLSWTKGHHDFKFGGEIRAIGYNHNGGKTGPFTLTFAQNTFQPFQNNSGFTNSVSPFTGFAFANMELGAVSQGSQGVPFNQYGRRKEYALFAQDDYKITPRLTASLGLRWDITGPLHELHGHWSNFNLGMNDPNFGSHLGAWEWLRHPGDSFETIGDYHQFGPHAGLSYQATTKSVVRGSYGVMYSPIGNNQFSAVPYGSAVGFQGTNQVNPVLNVNNQVRPAFMWDSGYPGQVTGASGPMWNQGYMQWGVPSIDPRSRQLGMIQNVYAGYEYQISSDLTVNAFYSGAFGRNLHDGYGEPWNAPTWQSYQPLLMSGHANDVVTDSASAAAAGVKYPYPGWGQTASNALLRFPQVAEGYGPLLVVNPPIGRSGYNSFTVEVTKRGKNGLAMDMSYNRWRSTGNVCDGFEETWSFGACGLQDPYQYNNRQYWGSATFGDVVKGYVSYALPIGRGQRLLGSANRLTNALVGGWNIGTIVSYGTGPQETAVYSTNSYPGWWPGVWANVAPGAKFSNTFRRWNPSWDPSKGPDSASQMFNPANFSNPEFGQLGNSPKNFQNWRGWSTPSENATITKKFAIGEGGRYVASIRADFFDIFNRHYWNNPDTDMGSPYFGHVNGVWGNRTGQLGARFQF